jgi:MoaA/NifB/PqqE/SkfB family radical SAM enzyme
LQTTLEGFDQMNPFVFAKTAKNALSKVEINFNRLIGREIVPLNTDVLNIETSSLCNLKCRFCAYIKKESPKVSMKDAFFEDCIAQALAMGFRRFELTPCTGDVFMDRHIFNKFEFLERQPKVEGYHFFTNFTIPKPAAIEQLIQLDKPKNITISIYGHDPESFVAITQSTEKVYARLMGNLQFLYDRLDQVKFNLDIGIRTTRDAPRQPTGELMHLLEKFKQRGIKARRAHVYNNWGGYITNADVQGLAIDVTGAEATYKSGACTHLFTTYQIMATGVVNGCACRDVDATLRIGDMNERPLHEILSPANPVYMQLIEEQQRGEFRQVCKSCDYYKSVYHMRSIHRKKGAAFQSIDDFKRRLRDAGRRALGAPLQPAEAAPAKSKSAAAAL